jgi:hypothetical protein
VKSREKTLAGYVARIRHVRKEYNIFLAKAEWRRQHRTYSIK